MVEPIEVEEVAIGGGDALPFVAHALHLAENRRDDGLKMAVHE